MNFFFDSNTAFEGVFSPKPYLILFKYPVDVFCLVQYHQSIKFLVFFCVLLFYCLYNALIKPSYGPFKSCPLYYMSNIALFSNYRKIHLLKILICLKIYFLLIFVFLNHFEMVIIFILFLSFVNLFRFTISCVKQCQDIWKHMANLLKTKSALQKPTKYNPDRLLKCLRKHLFKIPL